MKDIKVEIDKSSGQKLYEQLCSFFADAIEGGEIPPGEKLPSIRALSDDCGVGRNTVTKAYSELEKTGYITSKEKSGFFVTGPKGAGLIKDLFAQPETPPRATSTRSKKTVHKSPRRAAKTPDTLLTTEINEAIKKLQTAPDPLGESFFREQVALFLKKYTSLDTDKDHVVIEASKANLLLKVFLLNELASPGSNIRGLLHKAEYNRYETKKRPLVALSQDFDFDNTHLFEIDAKYVPLDKDSLEKSGASVVFVSAKRSYPKELRQSILEWAEREPFRYITEFDISKNTGNFIFTGEQNAARADKCLYFFDLADFAALPAKVSAAVLPEKLFKSYRARYKSFDCPLSVETQSLLTLFLKGMISK